MGPVTHSIYQWQAYRSYLWDFSWVAVAMIFAGALLRPSAWRTHKMIFLARLLFAPVATVSYYGFFALNVCHGVEYLCVHRKITVHARAGSKLISSFGLLTFALVTIGVLAFFADPYEVSRLYHVATPPAAVFLLNGFLGGLAYAHYYLDKLLFQMRHADNRELMGPLLYAPPVE